MSKRIAMIGAGALGSHVGAYLARGGANVTMIDFWPDNVEHMQAHGITLEGQSEPECFTQAVEAMHVTDLQNTVRDGPFDIAFVSVKAYDTVWATAMIADYLAPNGFVVSLQNGINEERIAGVVGWGRTMGCIASAISVELAGPGKVIRHVPLAGDRHTVFRIGEVHGRATPRAEEIAAMIGAVDSTQVTHDLWGERWSKLAVNCMRNPVSAATDRGTNDNDRDEHTRRLALRIGGEAIRVGRAHGFHIGKVAGMAPDQIVAATDGDAAAMAACEETMLDAIANRSDAHRPSMGQDIVKGRRTEIEFINGLVVGKAKELGLAVPANEGIVAAVKRIERGETQPGPAAVADL